MEGYIWPRRDVSGAIHRNVRRKDRTIFDNIKKYNLIEFFGGILEAALTALEPHESKSLLLSTLRHPSMTCLISLWQPYYVIFLPSFIQFLSS